MGGGDRGDRCTRPLFELSLAVLPCKKTTKDRERYYDARQVRQCAFNAVTRGREFQPM